MVWRHLRALGDSRGTEQPEDNWGMAQEDKDTGDDHESLEGVGWAGAGGGRWSHWRCTRKWGPSR